MIQQSLPNPSPSQTTKSETEAESTPVVPKKHIKRQKLFHVQIINTPVSCEMYRRIRRIEIHNPVCYRGKRTLPKMLEYSRLQID
jgi:hypothetical protein